MITTNCIVEFMLRCEDNDEDCVAVWGACDVGLGRMSLCCK